MESPTLPPFAAETDPSGAEGHCGDGDCTELKCVLRTADAPLRFVLAGFYALPGRPPLPCSAIALDGDGLHLRLQARPDVSAPLTAKFDAIGAVVGPILRVVDDVAVIGLNCALRRTLAAQIAFFLKPSRDGDQRRHLRIKPRHGETRIRTPAAKSFPATVEDISLSGAQIHTEAPLKIGETISFQRMTQAKVVRALDDARFGVEFIHPFLPDELTWAIRL